MILVSPLASEIELETRESGDPLKIEWDYLEKGIVRDACSQACPVLSCLLLSSHRDSLLVFSLLPSHLLLLEEWARHAGRRQDDRNRTRSERD